MTVKVNKYPMRIRWENAIVSFHPVNGYEQVWFSTRERDQARVPILVQSGFRFQ